MLIFKAHNGELIHIGLGDQHEEETAQGGIIYIYELKPVLFETQMPNQHLLIIRFPEEISMSHVSQSILDHNLGVEKITSKVGYDQDDFIKNRLSAILHIHFYAGDITAENNALIKQYTLMRGRQ